MDNPAGAEKVPPLKPVIITGTGAVIGLVNDVDIVLTNVDVVNVNTTTASTIVAGTTTTVALAPKLNLGAFAGHTVHLDTQGTASAAVTIQGFAAGTSGDKVILSNATDTQIGTLGATTGLTAAKILPDIQTTGVVVSGFNSVGADTAIATFHCDCTGDPNRFTRSYPVPATASGA